MTSYGRFFFFISLQSRQDVGTGLGIMSRGQKHTSNNCSEQRATTQMACKKSGFKSYRSLVGPIETQGLCTASATKSQEAHACYSSDVCGDSTTVYAQTQFINKYTILCCRCEVDVQNIETKLNTT